MRRLLSTCPAEHALKLLEGRWRIFILHHLFKGAASHADLRRSVHGSAGPVSQKMFTQELRDLEKDGLLTRTVLANKPVRVSYQLTLIARALQPILEALVQWGYQYEVYRDGAVQQPTCYLGAENFVPAVLPDQALHPAATGDHLKA